jgi:uncharacterized membrane protein
MPTNQTEVNEREWRDPANWHGGWLGIYHSRKDTRAWVPKRNPLMGATINFAHREGIVDLILILAAVLAFLLALATVF